ncbi:MAG: site-specific integrase [Chloroflexi bacterium]|nr:site-specific integrase [Chloroflexota bacterium]
MAFQPDQGIVLNRTAIEPIPDLGAPVMRDVLTQAEYESFRDALPTWRDRLVAMILRNTGLRINEVLSLIVKECALDGPTSMIYVQRSKRRRAAEYEPIYMNPGLGVQLRDYIKGQQMALTDLVFGNAGAGRGSHKITARGLRFVFAKAGIASIGRPVQPKEFRSFFVQTMVDGGVPMAMASKMMGHEDLRTTQAHYYALSADRRRVIGEGIPV